MLAPYVTLAWLSRWLCNYHIGMCNARKGCTGQFRLSSGSQHRRRATPPHRCRAGDHG